MGGGGESDPALLAKLQAHPFLSLSPPKSCGREEFDLSRFRGILSDANPRDAQATLLEWTAGLVANAAADAAGDSGVGGTVYLCGGGAKNGALVGRVAEIFPGEVLSSAAIGIPPDAMEAAAFAWLARAHLDGEPLDARTTTGAAAPRILGARHPR